MAALLLAGTATAQNSRLVIRGQKAVVSHAVEDVRDITFNGEDAMEQVSVKLTDNTVYNYNPGDVKTVTLGYGVPVIRINTDDPNIYDVADKVNYLPATFNMESNGYPGASDIKDLKFNIRGRGNTTMGFPKKPYRLKFDKKQQLHTDMKKAKNFALIANYIDNTLMRNTIAFTIAQLLEMPYSNHSIPVEVYFNDRYVGAYMLTEKVGINSGHMDDIDETKGIFFEMDSYFDEPYKFRTECYGLPMMIKDPDFDELVEGGLISTDQNSYLAQWAEDWNTVERILAGKSEGNIWDYIDLKSLVNYLIVCNVTNNAEISHPKSNYIHKTELGTNAKYNFGSVWDFDWAFTYYDGGEGSGTYNNNLFDTDRRNSTGSKFYRALIQQPGFREAYKEQWEHFMNDLYPELRIRMDKYADEIEESALGNFELWPQNFGHNASQVDHNLNGFRNAYKIIWDFLDRRVAYLNTASNFGFFEEGDNPNQPDAPDFSNLLQLNGYSLSINLSDMHPGDGTGLAGLLDNDIDTYHHSQYRDNSVHDPVYGSYVDWHLAVKAATFGIELSSRVHATNVGCPTVVVLYGSNDGSTWEKIADINNISEVITQGGQTGRFGTYSNGKQYSYIRFAVLESHKGKLTETDGNYTYWNASSLKLYGR